MVVILKPTVRCNIRCRHCCLGRQRFRGSDMTEDEARLVLQRIPEGSAVIFHGGEPMLLQPDYYATVVRGRESRFRFSLQSNLTLLTPAWIPFIRETLGGRISTSFDVHRSLRPVETGRWKENIRLLGANGISAYVVSMLWRGNEGRAGAIYDFFSSASLSFRLNAVENLGYAAGRLGRLRHSPMQYAKTLQGIFDRWFMRPEARIIVDPLAEILSFFILGTSSAKCPFSPRCALHVMSVNPDGTVYPCAGFDDLPEADYGNLLVSPLRDVLASSRRLQAIGRCSAIPVRCESCPYAPLCGGGCRLEALSYFGDADRETSLCGEYRFLFRYIGQRLEEERADLRDWWLSLLRRVEGD